MVTVPTRAIAAALVLTLAPLVAGCGGRSELITTAPDAATPPATPCVPAARPTLGTPSRIEYTDPPAAYAVVVDTGAGTSLWIGGLRLSGVYADRIGLLDAATGEFRVLPVDGDRVELPAAGAGVWDAANQRAVVIGGTHGGPDLSQAFAVTLAGTRAIVRRLPDYPGGPSYYPAAAYDPVRRRTLVTSFVYSDTPERTLAHRATYALDASPGAERWTMLVPGDSGPPLPPGGARRWMVHDPDGARMVLLGSGTRTEPGDAWALDLRVPTRWTPLAGDTLPALDTAPPLVRDPGSCGYLAITRARTTACEAELWWLGFDGDRIVVERRDSAVIDPSGGFSTGGLVFDRAGDRLLSVRGSGCRSSDLVRNTAEVLPLAR